MKRLKPIALFLIGGAIYITIEILWRGALGSHPTHWTMFVLGGLSFVVIGEINELFPWDMPIWLQAIVGAVCVILLEFVFGCVLNLWLRLDIWDYSHLPLNVLGQVCLPFAIAWFGLSFIAIVLDDWLRYWLFNEEKPRYKWTFK